MSRNLDAKIFAALPVPSWVYDLESLQIIAVNEAAARVYGLPVGELLTKTILDLRPVSDRAELLSEINRVRKDDRSDNSRVWRHITATGEIVYVRLLARTIIHQGRVARLVVMIDATEDAYLGGKAELVLAACSEATWDWDAASGNMRLGGRFQEWSGYHLADRQCSTVWWLEKIEPRDLSRVRASLSTAMRNGEAIWRESYRFRLESGLYVLVEDRGVIVRDPEGRVVRMMGGISDLSAVTGLRTEVDTLKQIDGLTQLLNRSAATRRVDDLYAAGLHPSWVAIADIVQFHLVNESLGRALGDEVLQESVRRLKGSGSECVQFARFAGNQFLVYCVHGYPFEDWIEGFRERFAAPIEVAGVAYNVSWCIGLATPEIEDRGAEDLFRRAEVALHHAKRKGPGSVVSYRPEFLAGVARRLDLVARIRRALAASEFELHLQPIICARTGRISGAEALARWRDPELGPIPPSEFIPICESSGLIVPLGGWVLRRAFECLSRLSSEAGSAIAVSVNVSAEQFRHVDLDKLITDLANEFDVPASRLDIEITESLLMEDAPRTASMLERLRATGVSISIDDFGTGYSSLAYLGALKPDRIKIDRSFTSQLFAPGGCAEVICEAIVSLARSLGLEVVAEGVENADQKKWLEKVGCDSLQGYHLGRPMSFDDLIDRLREETA